jgi:hypothetical protein
MKKLALLCAVALLATAACSTNTSSEPPPAPAASESSSSAAPATGQQTVVSALQSIGFHRVADESQNRWVRTEKDGSGYLSAGVSVRDGQSFIDTMGFAPQEGVEVVAPEGMNVSWKLFYCTVDSSIAPTKEAIEKVIKDMYDKKAVFERSTNPNLSAASQGRRQLSDDPRCGIYTVG